MNRSEMDAMRKALAGLDGPAMPPELKSFLRKEAREASARRRRRLWQRKFEWLRPRPALGLGAAAFAAAALVVVLRVGQTPAEVVSVDSLLSAHRRYESSLPLAGASADSGMLDGTLEGDPK